MDSSPYPTGSYRVYLFPESIPCTAALLLDARKQRNGASRLHSVSSILVDKSSTQRCGKSVMVFATQYSISKCYQFFTRKWSQWNDLKGEKRDNTYATNQGLSQLGVEGPPAGVRPVPVPQTDIEQHSERDIHPQFSHGYEPPVGVTYHVAPVQAPTSFKVCYVPVPQTDFEQHSERDVLPQFSHGYEPPVGLTYHVAPVQTPTSFKVCHFQSCMDLPFLSSGSVHSSTLFGLRRRMVFRPLQSCSFDPYS